MIILGVCVWSMELVEMELVEMCVRVCVWGAGMRALPGPGLVDRVNLDSCPSQTDVCIFHLLCTHTHMYTVFSLWALKSA